MAEIPQERLDEAVEAGFEEDKALKLWVSFNMFDMDNSGYIEEDELLKVLQAFGQNPKEQTVKKMLEEADTSGDGKVDFREFCKISRQKYKDKEARAEKLRQAFNVFDEDGSGYLNKDELKDALSNMGMSQMTDEEIDELFELADEDEDGKLNAEEFVRYLTMELEDMQGEMEE